MDESRSPKVMIVDDTPENLTLLSNMLSQMGYRVFAFPRSETALKAAIKNPPDMFLLDINMPEMDGLELCRQLKENQLLTDAPVLFISASNDMDDKMKAFHAGGVDYITKPFHFEEVIARVKTHLDLHRLRRRLQDFNEQLQVKIDEQVKEISNSQIATIIALAKLAESRDDATGKHIERVQGFSRILAEKLIGLPGFQPVIDRRFVETITLASSMHDIGKVGIPDRILLKPGKLTAEEYTEIKKHAVIGAATLAEVQKNYPKNEFINMGRIIALYHHERWDGAGGPEGLSGGAIPLAAQIVAFADVYDALRSKRIYKDELSHEESVAIIKEARGTQFNPLLVTLFLEVHEEFDFIARNIK